MITYDSLFEQTNLPDFSEKLHVGNTCVIVDFPPMPQQTVKVVLWVLTQGQKNHGELTSCDLCRIWAIISAMTSHHLWRESYVLLPSMHQKMTFVALTGIVWVIEYSGQASWFFTQEQPESAKGGSWGRGYKDTLSSFWATLVVTVVRVHPWGPTDFCWSWQLREAWSVVQKTLLYSNGWILGIVAQVFQISLWKMSHFCYFYGQMNCHIHVHPLPSNLFIKKKPVVFQFSLSRWLILISL